MTKLIKYYDEMTGLVDEKKTVAIVCLDFRKASSRFPVRSA